MKVFEVVVYFESRYDAFHEDVKYIGKVNLNHTYHVLANTDIEARNKAIDILTEKRNISTNGGEIEITILYCEIKIICRIDEKENE